MGGINKEQEKKKRKEEGWRREEKRREMKSTYRNGTLTKVLKTRTMLFALGVNFAT
jgi:hypothetical protein